MIKPRLTVILGAGSAINIGFPSTEEITSQIEELLNEKDLLAENLKSHFQSFFGEKRKINFEDYLFYLEELYSYFKGEKNYRNHIASLVSLNRDFEKTSDFYRESIDLCIKKIKGLIDKAMISFREKERKDYQWHLDFWKELNRRFSLDIISLNYDNIFEAMPDISFNSGYSKIFFENSVYSFDAKEFLAFDKESQENRIIRLHGSINFAPMRNYATSLNPEFARNFDRLETNEQLNLFWFNDLKLASREPIIHFQNNLMLSPIISSYNKTEKLHKFPFSIYYSLLPKIFSESPNMLIIGYGFNQNDTHLNNFLSQLPLYHKDKERFYIIDYAQSKESEKSQKNKIHESLYGESRILPQDRSETVKINFEGFSEGVQDGETIKEITRFFTEEKFDVEH